MPVGILILNTAEYANSNASMSGYASEVVT
jgi:hypothetical protein